jgi:hypothetical protein
MNKIVRFAVLALMLFSAVFAEEAGSDSPSDAPSDMGSDNPSSGTASAAPSGDESVGSRAVSASSLPLSTSVCSVILGAVGAGSALLLA